MPASFGTIRAVNPLALAQISGVTKQRGFASSPVAPVVRPDLLTSQLMGCHPQCEHCQGSNAGPSGTSGHAFNLASYIPPDYGTLRGNGEYGLFKMFSSQSAVPAGPYGGAIPTPAMGAAIPTTATGPSMSGYLGKGASGTNAANVYGTRSWAGGATGLRAFGKGASGTNAANVYGTRSWAGGATGLRGLGYLGQAFDSSGDPGGDTLSTSYTNILQNLPSPGAGGTGITNPLSEAKQIVPTQNALMAYLGTITAQIMTGQNPSVATLQQLYMNVWTAYSNFIKFVLSPKFIVRIASAGALNTVGPYIDGQCGYPSPLPSTANAGQQNCMQWGAGTIGGPGTTGMLGAIARAIQQAGGALPTTTTPQQNANLGTQAGAVAPGVVPTGIGTTFPALTTMYGGLSLTTWILIGLGVIVILRVGKR